MADAPTCGQGLAEHSGLAATLGQLTAAVADNVEAHLATLDLSDPASRREHDVYSELAAAHREIATRLHATGAAMASQRDLPMGRHDPVALGSAQVVGAFERLVDVEQELLGLLQTRLEQHRAMLAAVRGGAS